MPGIEQLFAQITLYIDPVAVIIAFALTQGIKCILPAPPDSTSRLEVLPFINRYILWMLPLFLGIVFVYLRTAYDATPYVIDDFIKGMISGIVAAWLYRTSNVVIFGK